MPEKIGFVGVGRMGSNMARRLKESGYEIAAVYDVNTAGAQALAQELGCVAAEQLKEVTKLSDVIITVVTDDKAMKKIFTGGLLSRSRGNARHFAQTVLHSARHSTPLNRGWRLAAKALTPSR